MQTKHPCLGVCPDIGIATRHVKLLATFVDRLFRDEVCFFFIWATFVVSMLVPVC